jgi:hypothetical protein
VARHAYDEEPEIREATIRFLCDTTIPEAVIEAREAILTAADGGDEDRLVALRYLDLLEEEERWPLLSSALASGALPLQEAALEHMARYPRNDGLDEVAELLADHHLQLAAIHTIAAAGEAGLQALASHDTLPPWRVLGLQWELYTMLAVGIDWTRLSCQLLEQEPDPVFWKPALLAAARTSGGSAAEPLQPFLKTACDCAATWRANQSLDPASGDGASQRLLERAAEDRFHQAVEAAVAIVLIAHPPPIERWERLLQQGVLEDAGRRSNLAEIVEQTVPRPDRDQVLALLEKRTGAGSARGEAFSTLVAPLPWIAEQHFNPGNDLEETMKAVIDRILFLSSVDLFKGLRGEELEHIAEVLEDRTYEPNQAIMAKGEPGDSLYLLEKGRVRVHDGERAIAELTSGDVVGEMALLDGLPRSADATAIDEVRAWRLDRADLDLLLGVYPQISRGIMKVLTTRLREAIAG